jgi:hypothetical protein
MFRRSFVIRCAPPAVPPSAASIKFLSGHWNVPAKQCKAAFNQAGGFGSQALRKRVAFLIAKGVVNRGDPNPLPNAPVRQFYDLITDMSPNKHWARRQKTLDAILDESPGGAATGQSSSSSIPDDISFFTFSKKHAVWADPSTSFVFFRDHAAFGGNATKQVLIQREQLFGTCAVHAPVVMQHYLVALANPTKKVPTVDIAAFLREKASAAMLEGIVFGAGTNSMDVLAQILVPGSFPGVHVPKATFDEIPDVLRKHGPLLLTSWKVEKTFSDTDLWRHTKPVSKPPTIIGMHSMLVVGSRRHQKTGEIRLLLQNWWHKKQFIEVGRAYYTDCLSLDGNPVYVTVAQPHIPADLTTTNRMHSISAADSSGVSSWGPGPVGRML